MKKLLAISAVILAMASSAMAQPDDEAVRLRLMIFAHSQCAQGAQMVPLEEYDLAIALFHALSPAEQMSAEDAINIEIVSGY